MFRGLELRVRGMSQSRTRWPQKESTKSALSGSPRHSPAWALSAATSEQIRDELARRCSFWFITVPKIEIKYTVLFVRPP